WDQSFEQVQISGPEELERHNYDPEDAILMDGTGNSIWVLRNSDIYYATAKYEGTFVTLEVERPEELPDAETSAPAMMTASGSNAWVIKGEKIYHIKWDHSFEKIQISGPEELDHNDYGPVKPFQMNGAGNTLWILRGNEIYYVTARQDGSFVDIEIERPEELPE
ncbi:MAG: hypothetical protein QGG64_12965, partial [Candidatus Latescibacteria bacterium]|nr:hypothetical protein [Candidatus Latescibacterota bacterium]